MVGTRVAANIICVPASNDEMLRVDQRSREEIRLCFDFKRGRFMRHCRRERAALHGLAFPTCLDDQRVVAAMNLPQMGRAIGPIVSPIQWPTNSKPVSDDEEDDEDFEADDVFDGVLVMMTLRF